MMAAFTWLFTFISLAGTVLNVRKNILCFYLWVICTGYFGQFRLEFQNALCISASVF